MRDPGRPHLRGIRRAVEDSETPSLTPDELLLRVARGDELAFEQLYPLIVGPAWGVIVRVVRDWAQAEEVAQEVLVQVWRSAPSYDPARGSVLTWVLTLAHRRAVDRVRSAQARTDRETRAAGRSVEREFDVVAEVVATSVEQQQVRRCLGSLTTVQRESVELAYYGGRTYTEVAALLKIPLGTVKTRLRDGLIRLRDCLGVTG